MIDSSSAVAFSIDSNEVLALAGVGDTVIGAVPALIGVYVAVNIGLALLGVALYRKGERRPLLYFSILSIAAFGPFGLAGSILCVGLRSLFARRAQPFSEWYDSLFPQHEVKQVQTLHELLTMRQAGPADARSVVSLYDIMAFGTIGQKQVALTLIADYFKPSFAPVLHSALSDPEPVIRVLAATAVARLESDFTTRWASLSQRLALNPKNPDLILAAAEHLASYAESGLLDAARSREMWQSAFSLVDRQAAHDQSDPRFLALASRILLRLGRPEEAIVLIRRRIDRHNPSCELLEGLVEGLFALGRFGELRQVCRQYKTHLLAGELSLKAREAVLLWAADHRVPQ